MLGIRKGERRDAWAAFLTLFSLIASHSILETARDALFLAKVPTSRLPWVFLAIAALSFALVKAQGALTSGLGSRRTLTLFMEIAAVVTFAFFALYASLGSWGIYALYVWSGLLVTLVLVHYWALVAELFTITQAKRLYGLIGAGSVLGAIAGSGAASLLSRFVPPEKLLVVSATGFAITGAGPFLFSAKPKASTNLASPKLIDTITYVAKDPYAVRVAASLFIASVCLTLSDFVFKSTIAALVPKAELGEFLGSVYFGINVLSLLCQLVIVGWVLKRVSLGAALAALPVLFVMAGSGVAITGGLTAALALKTADGSLRYSLHRTAAELLFLPFGEEARRRVKAFVDVVAQRGGQVVASTAILGLVALGGGRRVLAVVLTLLAIAWVVSALGLRKPYIDLFRNRLKEGRLRHVEDFPELDVASLETLIAALESDNDAEVLAALDILDRENKAHLIPALILYHPSERVVVSALGILTRSGRKNFVQTIDRVIDHPSPSVRAATVAARSVLAPDTQKLLLRLSFEESPEVRATIVVNLIASGEFSEAEKSERIEALMKTGAVATKVAFAEAIGRRRASGFEDALAMLASAPEVDVRRAAVKAIGSAQAPHLLKLVIHALGDEGTRADAEQVLSLAGVEAFDSLLAHFEDLTTDPRLRWRIPHALTLCSPERALSALTRWLRKEADGGIRFQVIRALERVVRRHPSLVLDRTPVDLAVTETLILAYRYLDQRMLLERGSSKSSRYKTPGHDLLRDLLRDKETNAKSRLFRLLGLLHPRDELPEIYRGLSASKDLRATSMELIETILSEPLRTAVIGLADDGDDAVRLMRGVHFYTPLNLDYEALLANLIEVDGEAVRDVTRFHRAELGISERAVESGKAA